MKNCETPVLIILILTLATLQAESAILTPAVPTPDPACAGVSLGQCLMRKVKCEPVKKLTQGTGGPVKDVFQCATAMAIPKMQVISALGPAFSSGKPETIVDNVITNNATAAAEFRRCVLDLAGVMSVNGTLDRVALVGKLQTGAIVQLPILDTVVDAINTCPEPENYRMSAFLTCVRTVCIRNMPSNVAILPNDDGKGDDDDKKKCKKGKKGKGCKKH